MATAAVGTRMSVEEYLRTSFRPDVDFVDGVIEERHLGTFDHARLQGIINGLFLNREEEWQVYSSTELRVRVSATRFRIPDVCVTDAQDSIEQIPTENAPLLCVEVLSPDDRSKSMLTRVQDYHRMGVRLVWIFDPETEKVWISTGADVAAEWTGGVLKVPGTKIELDPAVAFAKLRARR